MNENHENGFSSSDKFNLYSAQILHLPVLWQPATETVRLFLRLSMLCSKLCLAVLISAVEAAVSRRSVTLSMSISNSSVCFSWRKYIFEVEKKIKGMISWWVTCKVVRSAFQSYVVLRAAWKQCKMRMIATSRLECWVAFSCWETLCTSRGSSSSGFTNSTILLKKQTRIQDINIW